MYKITNKLSYKQEKRQGKHSEEKSSGLLEIQVCKSDNREIFTNRLALVRVPVNIA